MKDVACLMSYEKKPWVSLIKVTSCISYPPTLMARQHGVIQCIPRIVGLTKS
jgi:hypothetical protein